MATPFAPGAYEESPAAATSPSYSVEVPSSINLFFEPALVGQNRWLCNGAYPV
jgi:hypothetical protein